MTAALQHALTDGPTLIAMCAGGICAGWLAAWARDVAGRAAERRERIAARLHRRPF